MLGNVTGDLKSTVVGLLGGLALVLTGVAVPVVTGHSPTVDGVQALMSVGGGLVALVGALWGKQQKPKIPAILLVGSVSLVALAGCATHKVVVTDPVTGVMTTTTDRAIDAQGIAAVESVVEKGVDVLTPVVKDVLDARQQMNAAPTTIQKDVWAQILSAAVGKLAAEYGVALPALGK